MKEFLLRDRRRGWWYASLPLSLPFSPPASPISLFFFVPLLTSLARSLPITVSMNDSLEKVILQFVGSKVQIPAPSSFHSFLFSSVFMVLTSRSIACISSTRTQNLSVFPLSPASPSFSPLLPYFVRRTHAHAHLQSTHRGSVVDLASAFSYRLLFFFVCLVFHALKECNIHLSLHLTSISFPTTFTCLSSTDGILTLAFVCLLSQSEFNINLQSMISKTKPKDERLRESSYRLMVREERQKNAQEIILQPFSKLIQINETIKRQD